MLKLESAHQTTLFSPEDIPPARRPFRTQLLKWIGNKQKQADSIIWHFPKTFGIYFEPFLGSGGVLGVLAPERAIAGDAFLPLIEIWRTLHEDRATLKRQYAERYALIATMGKTESYECVLASYNARPNGADLLFLCRACYGGVVRFRKADGYMSTPVGVHSPVSPESFSNRVNLWHARTKGTRFVHADFSETMALAGRGDLIYCDPPLR
jgi:DNA adenine methylase